MNDLDQKKLFENYIGILNEDLGLGKSFNGNGEMEMPSIGSEGNVGVSNMDPAKSTLTPEEEEVYYDYDDCHKLLYSIATASLKIFDVTKRGHRLDKWQKEKIVKVADLIGDVAESVGFDDIPVDHINIS